MKPPYTLPSGWFCTGLAQGIELAGLPWTVCGVMLAGPAAYYTDQQTDLTASFTAKYLSGICSQCYCSPHTQACAVESQLVEEQLVSCACPCRTLHQLMLVYQLCVRLTKPLY